MKKLISAIFILFFSVQLHAQQKDSIDTELDRIVFSKAEIAPSYPGGEKELIKYFNKELNTGLLKQNGAPSGKYTVQVRMIVGRDGLAYDFVPLTKNGFGIEEEAVRIFTLINKNIHSYKMEPGQTKHKNCKMLSEALCNI